MNRQAVTALIAIVVIGGSVVWLVTRPPSTAGKELDEPGWRKCGACGYVWHMEISEIVKEQRETGSPWVKCPKCGELKGMRTLLCPECQERFCVPLAEKNADGQYICPNCGYSPTVSPEARGEEPYRGRERPGDALRDEVEGETE